MRCPNCGCYMTSIPNGWHCHGCGKVVVNEKDSSQAQVDDRSTDHRRARRIWFPQ